MYHDDGAACGLYGACLAILTAPWPQQLASPSFYTLTPSVRSCTAVLQTTPTRDGSEKHNTAKGSTTQPLVRVQPANMASATNQNLFPDLHHKMSKKIAQLTKVIYHLNSKNEEHTDDLTSLADAYETEIDGVRPHCSILKFPALYIHLLCCVCQVRSFRSIEFAFSLRYPFPHVPLSSQPGCCPENSAMEEVHLHQNCVGFVTRVCYCTDSEGRLHEDKHIQREAGTTQGRGEAAAGGGRVQDSA